MQEKTWDKLLLPWAPSPAETNSTRDQGYWRKIHMIEEQRHQLVVHDAHY